MTFYAMALSTQEAALVHEYLYGDREHAATEFIRQYQRFVYSVALRHVGGNHDDACDVAQETFIRAFQNLERFKGESSIQTWLYRIAVNTCHSFRRKWYRFFSAERSDSADEHPSALPTPDREYEEQEFVDRFYSLLSKLPPRQRETFYMRFVEGMSYEEISDILGVSISGLKANYYHAVRKLSMMLESQSSKGDNP